MSSQAYYSCTSILQQYLTFIIFVLFVMQHDVAFKELKVSTLNYSGILDSPYEFYSNELEKKENQVSKITHELLKLKPGYNEKDFKWKLGKIDQKCQKERYSPLYCPEVGVSHDKKHLFQKKQFETAWNQKFQAKTVQFQHTKDEEAEARQFDFLIYSALVAFSNDVKDLHTIQFHKLSAEKYLKLQHQFFAKSFMNEEKKIKKTIEFIQNKALDVIFLQELNQKSKIQFGQLKNYKLISQKGMESALLIHKNLFQHKSMEVQEKQISCWNKDTVWTVEGNLLFISGHLSSKKDKNPEQVATLWKQLTELKNKHSDLHVILGIDANEYLKHPQNQHKFHIFPNDPNVSTTNKKRTWLQPQVNKAEVVAKTCRDHIVSDLSFSSASVTLIDGSKQPLLIPTESHPYDHYIVSAIVKVPQ